MESKFAKRAALLRSLIYMEKGFSPPHLSFTVTERLPQKNYQILLNEKIIDNGWVSSQCRIMVGEIQELVGINGEELYEPFTGLFCKISDPLSPHQFKGWAPGCPSSFVIPGFDIITLHLFEVMRYCSSFLFDEHSFKIWNDHPDAILFRKLYRSTFNEGSLFEVLRLLLSMGLPISGREAIYQGIREAPSLDSPSHVAEIVRRRLTPAFFREFYGDREKRKNISTFTLEDKIIAKLEALSREKFPTIYFQEEFREFFLSLGEAIFPTLMGCEEPVLICPAHIRVFIERCTSLILPELHIFSSDELFSEFMGDPYTSLDGAKLIRSDAMIHSLEAAKWCRSRLDSFKKLTLSNRLFYKVAPILTGSYWNALLSGVISMMDEKVGSTLESMSKAEAMRPFHYLPSHFIGEFLFLNGPQDEAYGALEKALSLSNTYKDTILDRARDLFLEGDVRLSLFLAKAAIRIDSGNSSAWCLLGEIYKSMGYACAALKMLEMAVSISRRNLRALRVLASCHMENNEMEKAAGLYRDAVMLNPEDPFARYGLGMTYYYRGYLREAEGELCRALKLDPGLDRAYYRLGWIHMQHKRFSLAEQKFQRALELSPQNVEFMMGIGILYSETGESAKAARLLRSILNIEPAHLPARRTLAMTLWDMGERDDALKEYETLISIYPEEGVYHLEMGILLSEKGDIRHSIDALWNAVERLEGANLVAATEALGWTLIIAKEFDHAERLLEHGTSSAPLYEPFRYALGCAYYYNGKFSKARALIESLLGSHPDFEWGHYLLAKIYHSEGRVDLAGAHISKALLVNPESSTFVCEEASLDIEKGNPGIALDKLGPVMEREPSCAVAYLCSGSAHKRLGNNEQAMTLWLQGLNISPKSAIFYMELFFLYEETSAFLEMERLESLIEEHLPSEISAKVVIALIRLVNFELEEAEAILESLIPKAHSLACSYLALIFFLKKDYDNAAHFMKMAEVERGDGILKDSYTGSLLLLRGEGEIYERRCRNYIKKHGGDLLVMRNLGEFYLRKGEFRKAVTMLEKARKENPRLHRIHLLVAECHYREGRLKQAEKVLREGIKIFPRQTELHMRLGELLFEKSCPQEGERHLRKAILMAPGNIRDFYRFCLEYMRGSFNEVEKCFASLVGAIKKSQESLYIMAQSSLNLKKLDEAIVYLDMARTGLADSYLEAEFQYAHAILHWMKGEPSELRKRLQLARECARGAGSAILSEAFLFFVDGHLDEAEKSCRSALLKRPFFAEGNWLLGVICEKKGNKDAARKFYKKAYKIYPTATRYRESLEGVTGARKEL